MFFAAWLVFSFMANASVPAPYARQLDSVRSLTAAADRAYSACLTQHDPHQAAKLLHLIRSAESNEKLLKTPGFDLDPLLRQLLACARFELSFRSELQMETPKGPIRYVLSSTLPLETDLDENTLVLSNWSGAVPLEYSEMTYPREGVCKIEIQGQNGTLNVENSQILTELANDLSGVDRLSSISLHLRVGNPEEHIIGTCSEGSTQLTHTLWRRSWETLSLSFFERALGTYQITDLTLPVKTGRIPSDEVLTERVLHFSDQRVTLHTVIQLRHKPVAL